MEISFSLMKMKEIINIWTKTAASFTGSLTSVWLLFFFTMLYKKACTCKFYNREIVDIHIFLRKIL